LLRLGIESIKDLIETVALVVGATAILWGIRTYNITHNQLNFSVITNCVERFQDIVARLKSDNFGERIKAIRQYIDLCNEELFYFKKKYLPEEVIDEWLDGMISYLPLFDEEGNNLNTQAIPEIDNKNLLNEYPRIKKAFTVERKYDISTFEQRVALIKVIKQNLKKSNF
jgi:hypothetical protein